MYKLTRFTSYIEKNNIYAIYSNFNLYFFKGNTYNWINDIINNKDVLNIDPTFIDYLISKEIIEECD